MKKVMDLNAGELGRLSAKELNDRITTELSELMFFWMIVVLVVSGTCYGGVVWIGLWLL